MSDSDRPSDRFGEPVPDPGASPLIFRPSEPDDDDFAEEYPDERPAPRQEQSEPRSWTPAIVGTLVAVLAIAAGSLAFAGDPDGGEGTPIEVPDSLRDGIGSNTLNIEPLPSGDVEGEVRSSMDLAVRVTRQSGTPVPDTTISFRVESGLGGLSTLRTRTNAQGIASTQFSLPDRPGTSVVTASLDEGRFNVGRIIVTAMPGTASSLRAIAGEGQAAPIGELLPSRLVVEVSDPDGNPVPHADIRFEVTLGNGRVAPTRTRTDSLGRASTRWRLGMEDGRQALQVVSPDVGAAVLTFNATGEPRTSLESPTAVPVESRPVRVAANRFAVGGSHVCRVDGGAVQCRGGTSRGQGGGTGATGFVSLSAGASHTCGLTTAGSASCWGGNESGQLGDGSRTDRATPTDVRTELRFSVLAAGTSHTCGLAGEGVPLCWGRNLSGQLGDGTRNDQTAPRMVGSGLTFRTIAAGWDHTCGITDSGNAFCWGLNSKGQLGNGGRLDSLEPTLVGGSVETIVAGSEHTCGIRGGSVQCWGGNANGQLGTGSREDETSPTSVTGLPRRPTRLAAGAVHTCALVAGGQAFCWGQNLSGQLGDGTTDERVTPVPVAGGITFAEIYAGGAQTCGRTAAGEEYCWGLNAAGQLGDGSRTNRNVPTRVN